MKVVLSGIFYPVAILRYFEAALRRRNDVELFTVGPYTGRWIPWGMVLPEKYVPSVPDFAMPEVPSGRLAPIALAEARLPWQPDIWIHVDSTWSFSGKPKHGVNVIIATDPHCINYDRCRPYADYFFNMQKVYSKPGDIWLPYAYDPIWHKWMDLPKTIDVALLGMPYVQRAKLVDALRAKGISVRYELGVCYDDARDVYNSARIGLNWSSLLDLNARVFEVSAMSCVPVLNHVPDLDSFLTEGSEYIGFDTVDEAVERISLVLQSYGLWEAIAYSSAIRIAGNTYDARIQQIFDTIGGKCQT